jgi:hypothetical protein
MLALRRHVRRHDKSGEQTVADTQNSHAEKSNASVRLRFAGSRGSSRAAGRRLRACRRSPFGSPALELETLEAVQPAAAGGRPAAATPNLQRAGARELANLLRPQ